MPFSQRMYRLSAVTKILRLFGRAESSNSLLNKRTFKPFGHWGSDQQKRALASGRVSVCSSRSECSSCVGGIAYLGFAEDREEVGFYEAISGHIGLQSGAI